GQKCRDVVQAAVLIVQIVRVLPDIDGQQRNLSRGEGGCGIRGRHDAQAAGVEYQPCPAAAELVGGRRNEFPAESLVTAEVALDQRGDVSGGFTAAAGTHTLPKKGMVPGLRGGVEQ